MSQSIPIKKCSAKSKLNNICCCNFMQAINGCEKVCVCLCVCVCVCVCVISSATPLLLKVAVMFHLLVPLSDSFASVLFLHYDPPVNDQTMIMIYMNNLLPYQKGLGSAKLVRVVWGSVLKMGILLYWRWYVQC